MQVCQTLVSTGTKAVFLSPTDALHGDIGIVGQDDLVVIVSKSGATEELLRLVPYAKVRRPPNLVTCSCCSYLRGFSWQLYISHLHVPSVLCSNGSCLPKLVAVTCRGESTIPIIGVLQCSLCCHTGQGAKPVSVVLVVVASESASPRMRVIYSP